MKEGYEVKYLAPCPEHGYEDLRPETTMDTAVKGAAIPAYCMHKDCQFITTGIVVKTW